ncbi:Nitrous oxide reductase maturation periplasmic protein NosX [hydrothermal vent metagenome]|uniref:FAD:protein FMN transferase n=1 Tax=hydrothermal vent metagenome TaxID=652676 RepID=A0A3B0SJ62_9ZZZZ
MIGMMKPLPRRRFIQLVAASGASGALQGMARPQANVHRWSGMAMGAGASLEIRHENAREGERLLLLARKEIIRLENIFSLYKPDSALSLLNRQGHLSTPPQDLVELLSICGDVHKATNGAFDPTVQPLWAYHAETLSGARIASDPGFQQARSLSGWARFEFSPELVEFNTPGGGALTLNGIAQGYATDKVAAILRANGLGNVLVSVGEILAHGERGPGQPWRTGIETPGEATATIKLPLRDQAIATTAPLATTFDQDGRIGHILDPWTGCPADSQWRQISVIHSSAALADGLSTGMALMNKAAITQTAQAFNNIRVIAIQTNTNNVDEMTCYPKSWCPS